MERLSFLAQLNAYQELEVSYCAELPDLIHMVKSYPEAGLELFFDGATTWTSVLEAAAEEALLSNLVYA